jgi:tetratricopeptide (TPR) repeat protein
MATTTLRAYLDEVRVLLDQEALEEVIGHCRHILQHFPKNLDAYRLLGQALLEKNRPQEAIDVFHRVLGSIPDDFTAHLGLSAAYEEQDNYASAIFHMERGFEQAPNNAPLQAELKRLYGRANRPIPVRIPMTRGALARIYFKGKLYEQAINEIQQGLEQTPDRIDLLVIYALALWRSEHHDEAADIAMTVLESLPDALEANRIMASIWLATSASACCAAC